MSEGRGLGRVCEGWKGVLDVNSKTCGVGCRCICYVTTAASAVPPAQAVPLTVTSDARHTYHFYYCLFGNDIHSEPLGSLVSSEFQPERASVRFLTTAQWMGVFLAAQADFKVWSVGR